MVDFRAGHGLSSDPGYRGGEKNLLPDNRSQDSSPIYRGNVIYLYAAVTSGYVCTSAGSISPCLDYVQSSALFSSSPRHGRWVQIPAAVWCWSRHHPGDLSILKAPPLFRAAQG